jgi:hypothetical protein
MYLYPFVIALRKLCTVSQTSASSSGVASTTATFFQLSTTIDPMMVSGQASHCCASAMASSFGVRSVRVLDSARKISFQVGLDGTSKNIKKNIKTSIIPEEQCIV